MLTGLGARRDNDPGVTAGLARAAILAGLDDTPDGMVHTHGDPQDDPAAYLSFGFTEVEGLQVRVVRDRSATGLPDHLHRDLLAHAGHSAVPVTSPVVGQLLQLLRRSIGRVLVLLALLRDRSSSHRARSRGGGVRSSGTLPVERTPSAARHPMTPATPIAVPRGDRPVIHRLAAFTDRPDGGNPAGVVVTDVPLADADMLAIATEVGYSETAFLVPDRSDDRRYVTRYFSPRAEVSFCGHATIASAVLLGTTSGPGTFVFETGQGPVSAEVSATASGVLTATLTSVRPRVDDAVDDLVDEALSSLGWTRAHLEPGSVPAVAYAGARHLVLLVATRDILAGVDYDFERLRSAMADRDLTTVSLLFREHPARFHSRNLFPPGGVVEDPATGAAAAAFGAYLRTRGEVNPPVTIDIEQGVDLGRPSHLRVHIPPGHAGIDVSGTAVLLVS
jgi:PhzF family phenazine biosynthesis protein